jgi:AAHS family 4-hydroxybenzoate transporter-like MFS transporter
MNEPKTFDVNAFLDEQKLGGTHFKIVALLILTMMVDGYDIFLIGIILPALAEGLAIEPASMTIVFVMQQFGLLIGNFIVGPVADRVGRRVTLLGCLLIFGSLTLVTIFATTLMQLVVLRFIAGIFFSGVIPNTVSLVSEIVPKRVRATCVSITFAGYTLGTTVIGAPVLAWVVPFGWQYAFVVGGVLPLVLVVILYFYLPESLRFLVNNRPGDRRVPALLRRIDPALRLDGDERFVVSEERVKATKAPILALFQEGRWAITMLLWAGFHCAFIVSNLFGAWKNTVLSNFGGLDGERIALIMAVQGTAGIIGTLTSGFVMDRFGPTRVLPCYLGGAALAAASIAFVDLSTVWTLVAFGVFGYLSNGGLSGINALASLSYPSRVRATGISWAHGLGRAGAMIGPIIGGAMIASEVGVSAVFLIAAIPQLGASLAILAMHRVLTVRMSAGADARVLPAGGQVDAPAEQA